MTARITASRHQGAAAASFRFVLLYRTGTRCPGCNGASWHVGRSTAECAKCGAALPIGPNQ